jgi:decaprenyl-phosphate phosphoribosyltransferase
MFVLVPVFFAGKVGAILSSPELLLAFVSFCAAASAVYIFNDLFDRERDQLHEIKRDRPLAAGMISLPMAVVLMVFCLVISVVTAVFVGLDLVYVVGAYLILNTLYTVLLKNFSLIDVTVIAIGFVLRVFAGGVAGNVPISKWLILMTFLLACCLALGKRRDDLRIDVDKRALRPSLSGYTLPFIDNCLVILSTTTIVCYIMYTVSTDVVQRLHSDRIYLTSIFVIVGILRYLQIAVVEEATGSPTLILFKDRMIQLCILLWGLTFAVILYGS